LTISRIQVVGTPQRGIPWVHSESGEPAVAGHARGAARAKTREVAYRPPSSKRLGYLGTRPPPPYAVLSHAYDDGGRLALRSLLSSALSCLLPSVATGTCQPGLLFVRVYTHGCRASGARIIDPPGTLIARRERNAVRPRRPNPCVRGIRRRLSDRRDIPRRDRARSTPSLLHTLGGAAWLQLAISPRRDGESPRRRPRGESVPSGASALRRPRINDASVSFDLPSIPCVVVAGLSVFLIRLTTSVNSSHRLFDGRRGERVRWLCRESARAHATAPCIRLAMYGVYIYIYIYHTISPSLSLSLSVADCCEREAHTEQDSGLSR